MPHLLLPPLSRQGSSCLWGTAAPRQGSCLGPADAPGMCADEEMKEPASECQPVPRVPSPRSPPCPLLGPCHLPTSQLCSPHGKPEPGKCFLKRALTCVESSRLGFWQVWLALRPSGGREGVRGSTHQAAGGRQAGRGRADNDSDQIRAHGAPAARCDPQEPGGARGTDT